MVIEIGIISGEILELLENSHGLFAMGDMQSRLKEPHDLILMSLGWLLREGYVEILEDPLWPSPKSKGVEKRPLQLSLCDLIVELKVSAGHQNSIKEIKHQIAHICDEILALANGCNDILPLGTIENSLGQSRDLILMAIGWLSREGYVGLVKNTYGIFVVRLRKKDGYSFKHPQAVETV